MSLKVENIKKKKTLENSKEKSLQMPNWLIPPYFIKKHKILI